MSLKPNDRSQRVQLSVLDRLLDADPERVQDRPLGPAETLAALRRAARRDLEASTHPAIRAEMEKAGHDFSAAMSGKLKMVLQCLAVALVLADRAWPGLAAGGATLASAGHWVSWAAVAATVWSGVEYVVAARPLVTR